MRDVVEGDELAKRQAKVLRDALAFCPDHHKRRVRESVQRQFEIERAQLMERE